MERPFDDFSHLLRADARFAPGARGIPAEALDTLFGVALPPSGNRGIRRLDLRHDPAGRYAVRRKDHNLRPLDDLLGRVATANQSLQLRPVAFG